MSRWNRYLFVALASFVMATGLLGLAAYLHRRDAAEYLADTAPLPPPGRSVRLRFSPADNWQRYELQLAVSAVPSNSSAVEELPPPPCDLRVSFERENKSERSEHLRMHQIGAGVWQGVALFGTDVFEFSPGERDVEITNLGCDQGYAFVGGVLQMNRVSPVMFSTATLPLLLGAALALLGLFAAMIGSITLWRNRQAISPDGRVIS